MINFLEVYERALKGPIMSEKDFDMKVFIPKAEKRGQGLWDSV